MGIHYRYLQRGLNSIWLISIELLFKCMSRVYMNLAMSHSILIFSSLILQNIKP